MNFICFFKNYLIKKKYLEWVSGEGHTFVLDGLLHIRLRLGEDVKSVTLLGLLASLESTGRAILEDNFVIGLNDEGVETLLHSDALEVIDTADLLHFGASDRFAAAGVVLEGFVSRLRAWLDGRGAVDSVAGSGTDHKLAAVQVGDIELNTAESLNQGDVAAEVEIVTLALEIGVVIDGDQEHDVSRDNIRIILVALLVETNLVLIRAARGDGDFEELFLGFGRERTALTTALVARGLHLLNHGTHADDLNLDALAVALLASNDRLALVDEST